MLIFAAPIQGHTDASWRKAHQKFSGGIDKYFTPFIRIENGVVRKRDITDIQCDCMDDYTVIPQIIFKNEQEFRTLTDFLIEIGHTDIDMNLGCPFPPQVYKGRGAALIGHPDILRRIAEIIKSDYSQIRFSVKMRLGIESPDDWRNVIGIINSIPLTHLTVHPRTAVQQYKGTLYLEEFTSLLTSVDMPIIFNGDIQSADDADRIINNFPSVSGLMIGRGLLAHPWISDEIASGCRWSAEEKISAIREIHASILHHYESVLCGDAQILSKIKPYWEYLIPEIDSKLAKSIKKASSLQKYKDIIAKFS